MTETGVPALDGDHRHLLELLNELAQAALSGLPAPLLEDQSLEAAASLESHFAKEERMLAEALDPVREAHAKRHAELLDRLARLTGEKLSGLGPMRAETEIRDFARALEAEISEFDLAAAPGILDIPKSR